MKLSVVERRMLINQFLLLKMLDKENDTGYYDSKNYDNYITILHEGYEGLYDEFLFKPEDTVPKEITREVFEILYMYDRAVLSYEKLSEEEKDEFSKDRITLIGFDGNHEYQHYATYKFIVNDMKLYEYVLKSPDLNSHMSTLAKYRKQLDLFNQQKISGDLLNLDGLKKVFN